MTDPSPYRRSYWATQPDYLFPAYKSTVKRSPTKALIAPPQTISEVTGPLYGHSDVQPEEADLTTHHQGEPIGERMYVTGRVLDENGRPIPEALIEIWQANAAGRYRHATDNHDAPLDPNFTGCGRVLTDTDGRYQFKTIKPGAYPWRNHFNAWRPAHIHLSIFGRGFMQRLVTQFYFPGDPLLSYDPMYMSVPDERVREKLIAQFDWEHAVPEHAIAYRFDIVLRWRDATPMERR